jgi:hypothetical protein
MIILIAGAENEHADRQGQQGKAYCHTMDELNRQDNSGSDRKYALFARQSGNIICTRTMV